MMCACSHFAHCDCDPTGVPFLTYTDTANCFLIGAPAEGHGSAGGTGNRITLRFLLPDYGHGWARRRTRTCDPTTSLSSPVYTTGRKLMVWLTTKRSGFPRIPRYLPGRIQQLALE